MRKTKLYKGLAAIDRSEWRRLRKLVGSPFFNRSEEILRLLDILLSDIEAGGGSDDGWEKEELWEQLNPGRPYDDTRFRKYVSDLYKLFEEYFIQRSLDRYPNLRLNLLAEHITQAKAEPLRQAIHQQLLRELENNPLRNGAYYFDRYRSEKTIYYLLDLENRRSDRANIEEMSNHLDDFYLIEKLRFLILVYSRKLLKTFDYQLEIGENIIPFLEQSGKLSNPSIAIFYNIYRLYAAPQDESHYHALVQLLDQHQHLFTRQEAMDELYTSAINYCLGKANQGNQQFLREYFNLIASLLKNGLLIENNQLSPWHFRNTVVAGLRLGEYSWVENFISDYQQYLPDSFRANALSYNLAQLYFYQKRYDQVIQQLRNVEYEDISYNLNSKVLLIQTYFETDEDEALFSLLDSFNTFLRRRKDIATNRKLLYKNFINLTRKITKLMPGDARAAQALLAEIDSLKDKSINLAWLKEKVDTVGSR